MRPENPIFPDIPFSPELEGKILEFIQPLSDEGLLWLSGYIAGFRRGRGREWPTQEIAAPALTLAIVYGSQTGHAAALAENLAKDALGVEFNAKAIDLAKYHRSSLAKEQYFILITSTHGDGEPPDNALAFYDFLMSKRAPKLEHLNYAVLALGDATYPHFCKAGRDFDERLEVLGAKRLIPRADLGVDYEEPAKAWMEKLFQALPKPRGKTTVLPQIESSQKPGKTYSKDTPFSAEVFADIVLNGRGSKKETHHLELSLADSDIHFEPGDALGVLPENDALLVKEILDLLGVKAETPVTTPKGEMPVFAALVRCYDIAIPSYNFLQGYAEHTKDRVLLESLSEGEESARQYLTSHHIIDTLNEVSPKNVAIQTFVDLLRPLAPRSYSIASSLKAYPEEVHLTVGLLQYELGPVNTLMLYSTNGNHRSAIPQDRTLPAQTARQRPPYQPPGSQRHPVRGRERL
jgi:sulfite reductase (NADPH) flavoprotein alpha-component